PSERARLLLDVRRWWRRRGHATRAGWGLIGLADVAQVAPVVAGARPFGQNRENLFRARAGRKLVGRRGKAEWKTRAAHERVDGEIVGEVPPTSFPLTAAHEST